jgi:hypothetical protein
VDANKLVKLKVIGYEIRQTCANCVHSLFPNERTAWGTCAKHQYDHLKHNDQTRQLSIHRSGRCDDGYKASPTATSETNLGGFAQLLEVEGY